jgi:hypothetical protein
VKLRDVISTNIANRKPLLKELKEICTMCRPLIDARCKPVNGINVIAAIHGRIEQLAAEEHLAKLNLKVHKRYADMFKLILHVNEMPDAVQCKIKLKNAEKTITT